MVNKIFASLTALLTVSIILILAYSFINGATCRYSIQFQTDERDTLMTCYRGKVVAMHSKQSENGEFLSKWMVEARQFKLGNQIVHFIYSRHAIVDDHLEDSNDNFNHLTSGYWVLFYNAKRHGDTVYWFKNFTRYNVLKGSINGKLDYWDKD